MTTIKLGINTFCSNGTTSFYVFTNIYSLQLKGINDVKRIKIGDPMTIDGNSTVSMSEESAKGADPSATFDGKIKDNITLGQNFG